MSGETAQRVSLKNDIQFIKDELENINKRIDRIEAAQAGSDQQQFPDNDEPIRASQTHQEPQMSGYRHDATTPKKERSSLPLILIIVGVILTITIIGAIVGVPLIIIGVMLMIDEERQKQKTALHKKSHNPHPVFLQDSSHEKKSEAEKIKKTTLKTVKKAYDGQRSSEPDKTKQKEKTPENRFQEEKKFSEEDIGIRYFAGIGIVALVIGIGYFIKYAIDMNWIDHLTRVIMGCTLGVAMIIAGEMISRQERYRIWAKTLVGGGFAVVYFIIYAAYHFTDYREALGINQITDVILLICVTVAAVIFALKDDSQIIAAESFLLGYFTSLLSNDFGYLTLIYGLLLTIGLVVVVSVKGWSGIGLGGVVSSYILYLIWKNSNESFSFASFILFSYFISFCVLSFFLGERRHKSKNIAIILVNAGCFFLLFYEQLKTNYPDYTGLFSLILAVYYFSVYFWISNTKSPHGGQKNTTAVTEEKAKAAHDDPFQLTHLYLGLFFLTITIPIQLDPKLVTIAWALETLLLTKISIRLSMKSLRISSYLAGILTATKTFFYDSVNLHAFDKLSLISSTRLFSFIAAISCFYACYHILSKEKDEYFQVYGWIGMIFMVQILFIEFFDRYSLFVSFGLALAATILMLASGLKRSELYYQSLIISVIMLLKIIFFDTHKLKGFSMDNIFASTRLFSFIFAVISFSVIYIYMKSKEQDADFSISSQFYSWSAAGLMLLITFLELSEHPLWITIVLSVMSILGFLLSGKDRKDIYFIAHTVSAIIFLKAFFYDTYYLHEFDSAHILSSTRLFSFAAAIAVMYTIAWFHKDEEKDLIYKRYSVAGTILAILLVIVEASDFWISVWWSIIALAVMVAGFYLNRKILRMQGMVIFAMTIFKVFLYDTRNLETLFRTISYMVLGLVLLLVSFIYSRYKEKIREII